MAPGKVVHLKLKKEEEPGNQEEIKQNHALLKLDPLNQKAYQRLMILYRREKDLKSELRVIDEAIKAFEGLYNSSKTGDAKIARVSRQLNLAFGLTDKKGNVLYDQEPISTWKKRRKTVKSKLSK